MSSKRTTVLVLLGLVLTPLVLLALVLQTSPSVPQPAAITAAETRTLEQLIVDNSPDHLSSSGERVVTLNANELNLLTAFGSNNIARLREYAADFTLQGGRAYVKLSYPWPGKDSPFFLNLDVAVAQDGDQLELRGLKAGALPLPQFLLGAVSGRLVQEIENLAQQNSEFAALQQSISRIALHDDVVDIHLQWEPGMLNELRSQAQQQFLTNSDRVRILHYYELISSLVRELPDDRRRVSLHMFLPPLFSRARERSDAGDPVAENRALLQALSLYVNGLSVEQLLQGEGRAIAQPRQVNIALWRRDDLSQHFVSSAAIAASAGAGIAELLSNSKEVYDARYRSGFNFGDLMANIAGMTLGDAATRDETTARRLQQKLADAQEEADYMPSADGLMTGLSEEELANEFNDRDDPRYREKIRQIEARIAALPIYQENDSEQE